MCRSAAHWDNPKLKGPPVDLKQELKEVASRYAQLGLQLLVIDTERKFIGSGMGKELAPQQLAAMCSCLKPAIRQSRLLRSKL